MTKRKGRSTGRPINAIRAAICRRHGGFETATDREILAFWHTFDRKRQEAYLAGASEADPPQPETASEGVNDADSAESE